MFQSWFRNRLLLVLLSLACATGCGTIPDVSALVHSAHEYRRPEFAGAQGPLTTEQGRLIIAHLKANSKATDVLGRHLAFEQAVSGAPLITGNRVTLLKNGYRTYVAMLEAIDNARDSINLETYIITDDEIGRQFADALIRKHQEGVQVNLIYDSFGSISISGAFFDQLRKAGIQIVQFNPINPFVGNLRWSPDHRDHRKILVVDGKIAFCGGINISGVYSSGIIRKNAPPPHTGSLNYWRDTDVEVEGPAVSQFQELFFETWYSQDGPPLGKHEYFPPLQRKGNDIVRVLGSVPEQFSVIYVTLISAINNAETNVYITDAYFAPDQQMITALEHAAERGVDVRLLLPEKSDEPLIGAAARSHYAELLAAGVKIYEWRGKVLHAKTATIDGVWSTVGSSNLDWWSIARDNEVNAVILSTHFGAQMNLMFFNDLEESLQIFEPQWDHRPWLHRVEESIAGSMQEAL